MWGAEMLKPAPVSRMGESASASPWAATAVASLGCWLSAPGDVPGEVGPFHSRQLHAHHVFPGHELVPGAHPQRSCHLLAAGATGREVIAWIRTPASGL